MCWRFFSIAATMKHIRGPMLPFYSLNLVIVIAMAVFFYRAAEFEDGPGLLWAALSVAISLLFWMVFRLGWIGIILGQVGLFVGITSSIQGQTMTTRQPGGGDPLLFEILYESKRRSLEHPQRSLGVTIRNGIGFSQHAVHPVHTNVHQRPPRPPNPQSAIRNPQSATPHHSIR